MSVALRVVLVLLLLAGAGAEAHETLIATFDVRQVAGGSYLASWRFKSDSGLVPPEAILPEHCQLNPPRLDCGARGLVGTLTVRGLGVTYSGALIRIRGSDGTTRTFTLTPEQPNVTLTADGAEAWLQVARSYVPLGIEHILLGVDHLLFVLGLIWLVRGRWMLVKTITAFTVAHSLTLAAATFSLVGVPEQSVNAIIALSIMFVAVEALRLRSGQPAGLSVRHPWVVAFAFGLLHGFGFAGALTRLGLAPEAIPAALLFFNVGVEIGQLAFVALVLVLARAHRVLAAQLPRPLDAVPAYLVGGIATFWFGGRLAAIALP